jgi:hypothetical protein
VAGEANRLRPARVLELAGLEQARAMVGGLEAETVARRLRVAAVEGGTGAAVMGTLGAARGAGRSPSAAVAPAPRRGVAVAGAMEAARPAAEATMPVAAAMSARAEEVTAVSRVAGTPAGGYLPAEGTSPGAGSGRRWRLAGPRRRRSRGSLAGAGPAVPAAGHAAQRRPTSPAAEA